MVSAVLFITFFVLLVLNVPISICLGLSSAAAILYSGTSLTIVATNIYSGISKFLLLAIPFFVLSGNIMAKAGISTRLIRFVNTCVGHRKGGIANVCIIVACFFGAISGSGPATVAALGAVLIPAMVERGGFSAPFATALMATASSIAIVIPPSIAFVVYASITGVSIGDMFMAGIVPGILMGLALIVVVMLEVHKNHVVPSNVQKASAKERLDAFKDAFWGFLMPVIILGGIYGGIFTPTEAAAVSVVYGLFVGMVIYKEVKLKDLWDILIDSAKTTGGIMLIVACASLFSFVCTRFGISAAASQLLAKVAGNQFTFLLICNVIFLIAGCFIDANSAMYIFIPIMLPVCKQLGYNVIAFGIMATVNLAIGQVTPPVGVNLFVAIGVKLKNGLQVTLQQISRAVVSMVVASIAVLLLITYIPVISTFLPAALGSAAAVENGTTTGGDSGTTATDNEDFNTIEDYSDLDWPEMTWNFTCSTTETSTWAQAGRKFGELMEQATGGKVKVDVYAADQLTGGNQSEGIQALMNGDPVQISMHSNLIYSAFDPRFNVVSLPYLFDSVETADAVLDGPAGEELVSILESYDLHCMGMAENGFRQLTNSVHPVHSVEDMKNLKLRVAGSNLLMKCYELWGTDATNMNWSETYTALQQKTVDGQENPLPAIDAASVQEVQKYVSLWNANYDCLFFCINQGIYDSLTQEQQKVVDEAGRKAVAYEREINRAGDEEILERWQSKNGVEVVKYEDLDVESFKNAAEPVTEWFINELKNQGYEDAEDLVHIFTDNAAKAAGAESTGSTSAYQVEDHSDLNWPEMTWNFTCSTTETSTWAQAGRKFGELMEQATGGKVKVDVYAADQLTGGNQSEGIQALMNGDPVQISMHSNLIYSAFDPRFNVVSLPYLFDSVETADAVLDGPAGEELVSILESYDLHCMGMAENGFRQLTNSVHPVHSVEDMKNLKLRVAGSNLLMKCYELWGTDATNMNWSETYTALQQKTVDGQENPLPAIDAASVQEVQKYVSLWNANYDCLFFCINQGIYDSLTQEQQKVVDEAGRKAVAYEREINRAGDEEILERWQSKNGVEVVKYEDLDVESFKNAAEPVTEWFINELKNQGYEDAEDLVHIFTDNAAKAAGAESTGSTSAYQVEDHSDLNWPEMTWNFTCSTTETSTWAQAGRKFGELMDQATGGKVKVEVYAADQLTGGNQSEGIQALMNGDPVQISMHSNLIYSAFDPRFNVVSLPYLFDSVEDADAKLDGEAGQKMDEILSSYGLHCMGMAENGFRQLTNSVRPVHSVEDMKNLKLRVAGSNLLMKCYELWGADATNMNWSETYTALQQGTVDGQENPLPAIDAASVQEVQKYVSLWNANYDCLFFCINQDIYDSLTPEQQAVVDECGKLAVQYEREINRAGDDEILSRWQSKNGVEVVDNDELDIDSFKAIVEPVTEWYIGELQRQGYDDAEELVAAFK